MVIYFCGFIFAQWRQNIKVVQLTFKNYRKQVLLEVRKFQKEIMCCIYIVKVCVYKIATLENLWHIVFSVRSEADFIHPNKW